jgi:two-component system, NtrC family, response regulator AtoC
MAFPLIGVSQNISRVKMLINQVADASLNTVICGESGVGKDVVAQNLYHASPRNGKPFIKINCAAMPEGLLESELFGYETGAFTGADRKKRGKFELAGKGVMFLDEIGDMSFPLQAKLLHVLQGGDFSPLGSEKSIKQNAWVIAATNHELEKDISTGKFRKDLYFRLNIIRINISPLRSRPEDITPLINYYLKQYASQLDIKRLSFPSSEALVKLQSYSWPGNVRELQNIMRRCMILGNWEETVEKLSGTITNEDEKPDTMDFDTKSDSFLDILNIPEEEMQTLSLKKIKREAADKAERAAITHVLNKTGWNKTKASKILQISYKTLLYKINDLGIKPSSWFT